MFTLEHFIWIGVIAIIVITALILLKKYNVSPKLVAKISMIIAIICKLCHIGLAMKESEFGGMVLKQNQLDFHLCSIQVYLMIACQLVNDEKKANIIKGFMAPTMAIGALMAILIPTEGVSPTIPRVWQFMIAHGNLIFYGFYLMLVEKIDLSKKTYVRNLIIFSGFAMIGLMMNSILESYEVNYLYLRKPPMDNLPILNLDNGYFVYLITLIFIAVGLLTTVHLPFMLKESKK